MRKLSRLFILFFAVFCFVRSSYAQNEQAIHPTPKEPQLIQSGRLTFFKKSISLPPTKDSPDQKNDEKELFDFQKSRTKNDCLRAKSEVYVSLASFYGSPYGNLSKREVEILATFFEQIRNDADYYIQLLKKEFPRQRPFLYIQGLSPCVPKEVTGAYPSGHATLAKLYALILQDIFSERIEALESRSLAIATDRILAGMHHPSDIKAGRELAEELYKEFKKSSRFKKIILEKRNQLKIN